MADPTKRLYDARINISTSLKAKIIAIGNAAKCVRQSARRRLERVREARS
jgi:hypothetical protein